MKKPKKFCHDKVDKLKIKMFVATISRRMSVKRTGCNKFGVATQDIHVVTRTRRLHQKSIATLSKSIAT